MILITGNAGFIGRYLTSALLKDGQEIRGLDVCPRREAEQGLTQIEGNVLDRETVRRSMHGVDCIVHLAAEHKDFGVTKETYYEVNVGGTKILLETAAELGIKEFVFYSSVAVYGAHQSSSDDTLPQPANPYGASKLQAEVVVREWVQTDPRRKALIVRPTVVFGPRNRANIFRLVKQVCDDRFIWVGDGSNIKSVAYVENLVDATVFLMGRMTEGMCVLNYADRPHLTTREIVDLIAQKAHVDVPKRGMPWTLAIAAASAFDFLGGILNVDFPITSARIRKFATPTYHKAERIFSMGFSPRYSIEEGLGKMVEWYLEQRDTLSYVESVE